MAITPDTEQLLPVLQRYGFETLEKNYRFKGVFAQKKTVEKFF